MKRLSRSVFAAALAAASLLGLGQARADVQVLAGYYDLAPPNGGNGNALPNPWYGAPNTAFFGNIAQATSGDPDESGILLYNSGVTAVTLDSGFKVGSRQLWDSFIGAGYSLGAGQYLILAGTTADALDGSDEALGGSTISLSINGTGYSFIDSGHVLSGWPGGAANETMPWTEVGRIPEGSSGVPEPATWAMMLIGFGLVGAQVKRRAGNLAA